VGFAAHISCNFLDGVCKGCGHYLLHHCPLHRNFWCRHKQIACHHLWVALTGAAADVCGSLQRCWRGEIGESWARKRAGLIRLSAERCRRADGPVDSAIIQRHCIGGMLRRGLCRQPAVNAFIPNLMCLSGEVVHVNHY
jgi:hypothetical protein